MAEPTTSTIKNLIPQKSIVGLVVIILLALVITGIVVFLIFWVFKRASNGGVKQDQFVISDNRSAPIYSGTSSQPITSTSRKMTYSIACNIHNPSYSDSGKVILSRGQGTTMNNQGMTLFLDKNTNDVMLAFKTDSVNQNWYENFCIFKIENVPIYRWTVFHIVVDEDAKMAKVYIDGKLRKVCNTYACGAEVRPITGNNDIRFGQILDNNNTLAASQQGPTSFVSFGMIYFRSRLLSNGDIDAEAHNLLNTMAELQEKWNEANNNNTSSTSCPTE